MLLETVYTRDENENFLRQSDHDFVGGQGVAL